MYIYSLSGTKTVLTCCGPFIRGLTVLNVLWSILQANERLIIVTQVTRKFENYT